MIRIAIVEDDPADSGTLTALLTRYGKDNGVEFDYAVFGDPVMFLERYTSDYEIVFLDIEMPGLDGMKTAQKLREKDETAVLIFITRMAQFAVQGYRVNALDFIVKPANYYTLSLTMKNALTAAERASRENVLIPLRSGIERLSAKDIFYIEVRRHTLVYHTTRGDYERYGALKKVESEFKKLKFTKCNSCFLVNPRHVKRIRDYTVTVGDDELLISHPRKKEFMNDLVDYFKEE